MLDRAGADGNLEYREPVELIVEDGVFAGENEMDSRGGSP
jgi:hypothetical protein